MRIPAEHRYCVHGLLVEASFEIAELPPVSPGTNANVLDANPVRLVRASLPSTIEHHAVSKDGYLIGDGKVFMALNSGIRCMVESGQTVTIDPGSSQAEPAARLFALSAGLGTLLHQRGYMPLHCGAIETPAGCVAFAGNAGDGKSTLAASLSSSGFKLFTDDRLTLHATDQSPHTATPSLPILHLYEQGASLAGLDGRELAIDSYRFGKHIHLVPHRYAAAPRPMAGIYFTDWHDSPDMPAAITPLSSMDAMMRLRRDVSLAHLVELLDQETHFLQWAAALCRSLPLFSLKRPRDHTAHAASMDLIINHAQANFFP